MIVKGPRLSDSVTQISTEALTDGRLSFKARGILAYILSIPAAGNASIERITRSGIDGERAVKSGLRELEEYGYLTRIDAETQRATDTPGVEVTTPVLHPVSHPQSLNRPADAPPRTWMPGAQALKTAREQVHIIDIDLNIIEYVIRMKELARVPSDSEWLRWLIKDEQKLVQERKAQQEEKHKSAAWFAVAGD